MSHTNAAPDQTTPVLALLSTMKYAWPYAPNSMLKGTGSSADKSEGRNSASSALTQEKQHSHKPHPPTLTVHEHLDHALLVPEVRVLAKAHCGEERERERKRGQVLRDHSQLGSQQVCCR